VQAYVTQRKIHGTRNDADTTGMPGVAGRQQRGRCNAVRQPRGRRVETGGEVFIAAVL